MALSANRVTLSRDCTGVQIPEGSPILLHAGKEVEITQALGGSYTVLTDVGYLVRISGRDGDAIGQTVTQTAFDSDPSQPATRESLEAQIWDQLKTCYDPEIPVNIVDLGLIYKCEIQEIEAGQFGIHIDMTLTAPGCGMGPVLQHDVEQKMYSLKGVQKVNVAVVFEPQWDQSRMTEAARLELNLM